MHSSFCHVCSQLMKVPSALCRNFVIQIDIGLYVLIFAPQSTFFLINFLLFLAVLGLCCYRQAFSSCGEWGLLSSCGAETSRCGGFSSQNMGSTMQARCCGAQA